MNKSELHSILDEKHDALFSWLDSHAINKWDKGPEGKWTTGQHIKHLIQSMQPFNKALILPKFFLGYKFGKSNRETRTYDVLVQKYQDKLIEVGSAVSPFSKNMGVPTQDEKEQLIKALNQEKTKVQRHLGKWKEADLDTYIVPHPLLGRMPFREMFMFMALHTEHHHKTLTEKYE